MLNVDLTIEPNAKYRRVIGGYRGDHEPATDHEEWSDEEREAANEYTTAMDSAPEPDELDIDEDDIEPLSWEMLSVSSDPDLVTRMATYFDGMDAHERTERLRAKLRLLDVEDYVNVQVAARNELRAE
jgi:hypothetical protein